MRRVLGWGLLLGVLASGFALVMRAPAERRGLAAPFVFDVQLSPVAAEVAARYAGEVILLDVWATWCDNCVPGLRELAEVERQYAPRGLRVVAISVDRTRDSADVRAWAQAQGVTVPLAYDPSGKSAAMLTRPGVPIGLLLDRQGRVRETRFGHAPLRSETGWLAPWMQGKLEALLAEPRPEMPPNMPGA